MASSNPPTARPSVWFCHECNRECQPLRLPDPHCSHCHSTFVEELSAETGPDNHPRQWTTNETRNPPDSTNEAYPSPPIPSTRQRYEQEQREAELRANVPEMLGPLLNLFGIQQYLQPQNPAPEPTSPRPTATRGNHQPSFSTSNQPSPLRRTQSNLTESSSTRENGPSNETEHAQARPRPGNNAENGGQRAFNHEFRFTFDSDGIRTETGHTPGARPPTSGFFSFIQQAMGQVAQPHNPAPTTTAATQPEAADDDRIPDVADDFTQVRWTDDGDHLHNPTPPPPPPRGGGVNVEEGHPLRELISLLSSLVPPNNDGFIIGGGTGGARFEFGAGAGGQFGDYVFSDTGLQDVMDQLMNMAGVAGTGHQPVPASEAKIKSLRRFKVDPKTLDGEPGECAICKEEYVAEEECMQLPCKHVFHAQDCITPWLKRNGTCPVCRFSLVNDPSDDPEDVPLEPQANGSGSGRSMADLAAEAAERRYRAQHEEPALDVD